MDYQTVFLNPNGRLGPADFQKSALILIGISFVLSILPAISLAFSFLGIIGLLLIYPWVCLWSKRLHDAGQSGWMTLVVVLVWIVVGWITGSIVGMMFAGDVAASMSGADPQDFGSMMSAITQASRATIIPSAIVNAGVAVGFVYVANMILKSDPGDNQYGPPPGSTIEGQSGGDDIVS